ncbi:unnamed protein product [Eretmochelys imbricata]
MIAMPSAVHRLGEPASGRSNLATLMPGIPERGHFASKRYLRALHALAPCDLASADHAFCPVLSSPHFVPGKGKEQHILPQRVESLRREKPDHGMSREICRHNRKLQCQTCVTWFQHSGLI